MSDVYSQVVMTADYGRHKAGDIVDCVTKRDEFYLVERERVALPKKTYDAQKALEDFNPYAECNRKRVATTSVIEEDVNMTRILGKEGIDFEGGTFPIFNGCTHTLVDLYAPRVQDLTKTNNMHTVSIRLPNGDYLTVAVIPYGDNTEGAGCIDIAYYGDKEHKVIGFKKGGNAGCIDDPDFTFHTLTYDAKDTE